MYLYVMELNLDILNIMLHPILVDMNRIHITDNINITHVNYIGIQRDSYSSIKISYERFVMDSFNDIENYIHQYARISINMEEYLKLKREHSLKLLLEYGK